MSDVQMISDPLIAIWDTATGELLLRYHRCAVHGDMLVQFFYDREKELHLFHSVTPEEPETPDERNRHEAVVAHAKNYVSRERWKEAA